MVPTRKGKGKQVEDKNKIPWGRNVYGNVCLHVCVMKDMLVVLGCVWCVEEMIFGGIFLPFSIALNSDFLGTTE